ncbi:MAG: OsmC family protein [Chitinophagales bacterium]
MNAKISLSQIGEQQFDILQNGKTIRIDTAEESVSTGVRPKALILSALAGCTAIDVVDLLKKMRVEFSDFKIDVEGELSEEHPKIYHTVTLTYYIRLHDEEDKSKMEKAVNLSQEKYCGVSAMVKKFADLKVHTVYW